MASASNSAGFVGKWGQASYVPINSSNAKRTTPKKFFRSKNAENSRTDLTPVRMATTPKGSKFATPMSVPRKAPRENRKCLVAVRVRPVLGAPDESVTEVNDAVGQVRKAISWSSTLLFFDFTFYSYSHLVSNSSSFS